MTRLERRFHLVKRLDAEMARLQSRWAQLLKRKTQAMKPLKRTS